MQDCFAIIIDDQYCIIIMISDTRNKSFTLTGLTPLIKLNPLKNIWQINNPSNVNRIHSKLMYAELLVHSEVYLN